MCDEDKTITWVILILSREVDSQISNMVPISIWNEKALNSPVKQIRILLHRFGKA